MRESLVPIVVISRCIEHDHCRWNGMRISSDLVKLLRPFVEFIPVCGEVEVGLGVPRDPVRLIDVDGQVEMYQPGTGLYCTAEMNAFSQAFLAGLDQVDGFLLKNRSPTCGMNDVPVYPGTQPKVSAKYRASGLFARAVQDRYSGWPIEDEGRLTNFGIREHFLTRLFALTDWRHVREQATMSTLVGFQSRYKLTLMAYDQRRMRDLGRLVANHEGLALADILARYEGVLRQALARPAGPGAHVNVLMHALGYFDGLGAAEKEFFLDSLEDFKSGQLPLSVPVAIIRSWIVRFGQAYLADQVYFAPYPEDLVQITDSGKGRDL